jgi:peroxiredoxin Q/BCP
MKSFLFSFALIMANLFTATSQQGVSVGDKAPAFSATTDDGSKWNLGDHLGKNYLVVYFFPGALTSGCTKQACAYRDNKQDLVDAGIDVVGISTDKPDNLKLFRKAENLNFTLLSDEKGDIARLFGVPLGQGGSLTRVVDGTEYQLTRDISDKRWTFILDKNGKVVYKNDAVDPEKDSQQVLSFIQQHKQSGS